MRARSAQVDLFTPPRRVVPRDEAARILGPLVPWVRLRVQRILRSKGWRHLDVDDLTSAALERMCRTSLAKYSAERGCPEAFFYRDVLGAVLDAGRKQTRRREVHLDVDHEAEGTDPLTLLTRRSREEDEDARIRAGLETMAGLPLGGRIE